MMDHRRNSSLMAHEKVSNVSFYVPLKPWYVLTRATFFRTRALGHASLMSPTTPCSLQVRWIPKIPSISTAVQGVLTFRVATGWTRCVAIIALRRSTERKLSLRSVKSKHTCEVSYLDLPKRNLPVVDSFCVLKPPQYTTGKVGGNDAMCCHVSRALRLRARGLISSKFVLTIWNEKPGGSTCLSWNV